MCVAEIPAPQEARFSEVVCRNLHIRSMLCKCLNELGYILCNVETVPVLAHQRQGLN